jgi:hypothetical protein
MSAKKLSELPQQTTLAGNDTVLGLDVSALTAAQTVNFPLDALASWILDQLSASDVLAALLTVDGAASGIDADLLDGNHASAFLTSIPFPGTTTLGGVKRNTGSAGQFVTGIDTDGSLLRDTPSGGSSASNPGVAYVSTSGNNEAAEVGNPAKPFLTAQAAWNAGARIFELGAGSFNLTHNSGGGSPVNVYVRGCGPASLLSIEWHGTAGGVGGDGYSPGEAGGEGATGLTPDELLLYSDESVVLTFSTIGGSGGAGGRGADGDSATVSGNGGNGGGGGDSAVARFYGCLVENYFAAEGEVAPGGEPGEDGGAGVGDAGSPGAPGNLSTLYFTRSTIGTYNAGVPQTIVGSVVEGVFTASS